MEEKKILINDSFLSLPPRVSVSWKEISSLYMKEEKLHILLQGGEMLILESLSDEVVDMIFFHHAQYLERKAEERHREAMGPLSRMMQLPDGGEAALRMGMGLSPLDSLGMGMMIQHNPEQKDAPPLPEELLEKVSGVIRLLVDDAEALPKPEEDCHCFHCQIAKALNPQMELKEAEIEEDVAPAELSFSDWAVEESGEKVFMVINKLNQEEKYSVYLGSPVGCTCGKPNCEHVIAALKS